MTPGSLLWRPLVQSQQDCYKKSEVKQVSSVGKVEFAEVGGEKPVCPCWQPAGEQEDLQCADGPYVSKFFSRIAYHQFNSLVGHITQHVSEQDIITGPWVASKFYR